MVPAAPAAAARPRRRAGKHAESAPLSPNGEHRPKNAPPPPAFALGTRLRQPVYEPIERDHPPLLPLFVTVTLGASVAVLGAIDGVAEATASFAKLLSGRLSDKQQKRKPWILTGYGLAALTKPLMALAGSPLAVLGARLVDRTAKGLRGAPRDALIADETPPEQRGAAYGLRQSSTPSAPCWRR
ncbi:MFS transporter [Sphingomonas sp. LHG3443-2]|uniref:MFS transporter n=1 Tax=Sphingomonas sp. LHG3443-2 TaxID=2804639 RepID=UPI003CFAB082